MAAADSTDRHLGRQARLVALVIAGTMILWMGAQYLGGMYGWPPKYVLLFDLSAMAAFIWALVVTVAIWRRARRSKTGAVAGQRKGQ